MPIAATAATGSIAPGAGGAVDAAIAAIGILKQPVGAGAVTTVGKIFAGTVLMVIPIEPMIQILYGVHDVSQGKGRDFDPAVWVLGPVILRDGILGHIPVVDKDHSTIAVQEGRTGLDLGEIVVAWSTKVFRETKRGCERLELCEK